MRCWFIFSTASKTVTFAGTVCRARPFPSNSEAIEVFMG
jgi:hypothetical protein